MACCLLLVYFLNAIHDDKGTSILLVGQNASSALDIADWGYVMGNGRSVLDGSQRVTGK
jgi:branched-chain amino acid transport system ATP-binding protein